MHRLSYEDIQKDADFLVNKIPSGRYNSVRAIERGGIFPATVIANRLGLPLVGDGEMNERTLVVDDLIDSGATLQLFQDRWDTAVLYRKPHSPPTTYYVEEIDDWIEFPYEQTERDEQHNIVRLLETIGEDPTREGLLETPKRVMKFYREFLSPPEFNFTTFAGESYDEMIVQKDIPFFSLCEHHLAPFFGTATVAYIPDGKIVGLSKLARTVDLYARKLQNQERVTSQIAERLHDELEPLGVAVTLKARHFCMEMRGIRTHDVQTVTTKLVGAFKDNIETRNEYLRSI